MCYEKCYHVVLQPAPGTNQEGDILALDVCLQLNRGLACLWNCMQVPTIVSRSVSVLCMDKQKRHTSTTALGVVSVI